MMTVSGILFSFLLSTALCAPVKVKEETNTLFHGDDFHILLPSQAAEVTFRSSSAPRATDVILMRDGNVVSTRAKLNQYLSHLILDAVGEADEGVYTVKNPETPDDIRSISLIVRDCSNEQNVKYGDNFHIQLLGVMTPISLEYKPSAVEATQTSRPALVLLTSTGLPREGYHGRFSVNDRHVTLNTVTGADEGSYTVRDAEGKIQRKVCLNVKEHQNFERVPYGETMKIHLILNSSLVKLNYIPDYDHKPRLLMDKGEFTSAQTDLGLEGRLSLDGSVVLLERVKRSDAGEFEVTDILGFHVTTAYLEVEPYRLPPVYVAVIALLGLLVSLLLVCLLSCLVKVKNRAKRAAALEKIAENAGKEDEGEAFRQVVKNITQLNEESKHSQADTTEKSQSTEVDIKGLEVSSKEVGLGNLETSDSGVGFNTTALPLDTDTDVPDQVPDSEAVSISVATDTKPSAPPAAEMKPSPVAETNPSPLAEKESSPAPEAKKIPDQPAEPKLDIPKPADVKQSPVKSPEPKSGLSPISKPSPADGVDAKTPEPKPAASLSPEPKPTSAVAPSPEPIITLPAESKTDLTPTPEPSKPTTPEPVPIANGTPEPVLESGPTEPDWGIYSKSSAP